MSSKVHELRCWPPFWRAVLDGVKTFEIRENDREFAPGDVLVLHEFVPNVLLPPGEYTGAAVAVQVTAFWYGVPGLATNYVVLGIKRYKGKLYPSTRCEM